MQRYTHVHTPALCPGLMTFRGQPTILFVPLECRYVAAASAAALQLQPEASATKLPETMRDREGGRGKEKGRIGGLKDGKKEKVAGH